MEIHSFEEKIQISNVTDKDIFTGRHSKAKHNGKVRRGTEERR